MPDRIRPRSLPQAPTSLIDREEEIAMITRQLHPGDVRLLTLTGPPGVGAGIVWLVAGVAIFALLSLVLAAVVSIFPFLFHTLTFVTPIVGFVWGAMTVWFGYRAFQGQMFSIPVLRTYTAKVFGVKP